MVVARIEDVCVEPVLVRGVAQPSVALVEHPAMGPAEVADEDRQRVGMRRGVLAEHALDRRYEDVGAPAPPAPVRDPLERKVPGQEAHARLRELHPVDEPAVPRLADGDRVGLRRRRGDTVDRYLSPRRRGEDERDEERCGDGQAAHRRRGYAPVRAVVAPTAASIRWAMARPV